MLRPLPRGVQFEIILAYFEASEVALSFLPLGVQFEAILACWVPLLSVCVCLGGFEHLAQVPHRSRPGPGRKGTVRIQPKGPFPCFPKRAPNYFDSFELAIQARSNDAFAFRVFFGSKVWGGFGNLWLFRCLMLTKGSKALEKTIRIQPNGPFPNGPKGPLRPLVPGPWPLALWSLGPLVPWPFGPLALWSRRALVLSSKHGATSRRSESTTERQYDGASLLGRRAARSVYELC